ncbi:hypothetical protein Cni_G28380 [Canna indica]|uniref:Uncharacterized protein n=1 Tax=Canna indica TaxID=4628 RepID=A0AAQ3L2L1_9LILI|nr:hypothetical protein Cni_G28380 [Canna indica]
MTFEGDGPRSSTPPPIFRCDFRHALGEESASSSSYSSKYGYQKVYITDPDMRESFSCSTDLFQQMG